MGAGPLVFEWKTCWEDMDFPQALMQAREGLSRDPRDPNQQTAAPLQPLFQTHSSQPVCYKWDNSQYLAWRIYIPGKKLLQAEDKVNQWKCHCVIHLVGYYSHYKCRAFPNTQSTNNQTKIVKQFSKQNC